MTYEKTGNRTGRPLRGEGRFITKAAQAKRDWRANNPEKNAENNRRNVALFMLRHPERWKEIQINVRIRKKNWVKISNMDPIFNEVQELIDVQCANVVKV